MSTPVRPPAGSRSRGAGPIAALAPPLARPSRAKALLALMLVPLALLMSGCLSEYPMSIFDPRSSDLAPRTQTLFLAYLLPPVILVFIVVEGALFYTMWRFRQRPGHSRPDPVHGNTVIEIMWTIAPAVVLAFIAVPTVRDIFYTQQPAAEAAAQQGTETLRVNVIGHQWWWELVYPDIKDAEGNPLVTANELVAPTGRTLDITETSADVIHSWWIPAMGGKRDVVPNHENHIWYTPSVVGEYYGQCAEYCGGVHADMRMRLRALSPADFDAWVKKEQSDAASVPFEGMNQDLAKQAQPLMAACAGCHTLRGNPALQGKVGPNLTHVGGRTTIAAGKLDNSPENIARWVHDPSSVKPGVKMPSNLVTVDQAAAIAQYLYSLK